MDDGNNVLILRAMVKIWIFDFGEENPNFTILLLKLSYMDVKFGVATILEKLGQKLENP